MSTSSYDSIWGVTTGQFVLPVGTTVAQYVNTANIPGCNSVQLKYHSGGTLQIFGTRNGTTLSANQLGALGASTNGYYFGTSEVLSMDGPVCFYLAATGATTFVSFIFGRSQG